MEHNLKEIETFKQSHRAHILKAKLEEAGIDCFLVEETVFNAIEGVKVSVDSQDYEAAMEIYKSIDE